MAKDATPVVVTNAYGTPVTPADTGTPVTIVGGNLVVLREGDSIDTDDGGSVTIDTITDGAVTGATYTAP